MTETHRYFPNEEYRRAQMSKMESVIIPETHQDLTKTVNDWITRTLNDPEQNGINPGKSAIKTITNNWFMNPAQIYQEMDQQGGRYQLQGLHLMIKTLAKDVSLLPGVANTAAHLFME